MDEGCKEGQSLGERHVLLGPVFNNACNVGVPSILEKHKFSRQRRNMSGQLLTAVSWYTWHGAIVRHLLEP
jgi:hypothetical protein